MLSPRSFRLPPNIRQLIAAPLHPDPPAVSVSGWIKSIRRQKNITFAVVTDGSVAQGLQAVFVGNADPLKLLTNGAAVRLTGKLVPSPGSGQDMELLVDLGKGGHSSASQGTVQVLGTCDAESYPIQKQTLSTEYLRDHAHLRPRTDSIAAMIRLRNQLKRNIESFFEDQGFCYAHTPVLTGSDAEGAGETFKLAQTFVKHPTDSCPPHGKSSAEFFGRPAYLTVSHQLHLEALATSLSRVYTVSPCFRAEPSLTGRHLAEFMMLEAEWAFGSATDRDSAAVGQVCDLVEGCLRNVVDASLSSHGEMSVLWKGGDEKKRRALGDAVAAHEPWTRITYTEAVKALADHVSSSLSSPFHFEPVWGRTLQSEHERWLAETLVGGPLFITDYPRAIKPFYMRSNPTTNMGFGATVACVDLIVPYVGELAGGSVREERIDILEENLGADAGAEAYRWYLDLRRFGGASHAGFGMGFERLVSWVAGIENVREAIPFPRWAGRMLL